MYKPSVTKSKPITFIASYDAPTEQYDEDFDIQRVTPDDEYEPGHKPLDPLTDTDWFDEELHSHGAKYFLETCNVMEDLKKHGKIKVVASIVSTKSWTSYGDEWDLDLEVESVEPA